MHISERSQRYIAKTSREHRKKYGQFFTPPAIAERLAAFIREGEPSVVCDPAFGTGVFREALPGIFFLGFEADKTMFEFARNEFPDIDLCHASWFDDWRPHEAIICNPPFLKFHKIPGKEKILDALSMRLGRKVPGTINMASAFLLKAVFELVPGGRLAFILPTEFLNANYGVFVKQYLLENGRTEFVKCEDALFEDAITTAGLVFFEKSDIHVASFRTLAGGVLSSRKIIANPEPAEKWEKYFEEETAVISQSVPLLRYGNCQRGIATGNNRFFCLDTETISMLELGFSNFRPCVTSSRQISEPVFTERDFLDLESPCWLLDVKEPKGEILEYFREGEKKGVAKGYLVSRRNPWWKQEARESAPLWLAVFGRDEFKVVRNLTKAVTLSCFHNFFPKKGVDIEALFAWLTSAEGQDAIRKAARRYGKNLLKLEPRDWENLLVPKI